MPYRHLDEFLIRLEQSGDLVYIEAPVSVDQEIAAITQRVAQRTGRRNVALWFDNVDGFDIPVVTNLLGTEKRMAWALGVDDLDEPRRKLSALLNATTPGNLNGLLSQGGALMGAIRSMGGAERAVSNPLVQQIKHDAPDVRKLPVPRYWSQDASPALTMAQVITRDKATGTRRVSLARVEIREDGTLGIPRRALSWLDDCHCADPLPAAIVLGGDPAAMWCAAAPRPRQIDPYLLAGWLRRRPVAFANGVSQMVSVPSDAEFAIEGVLDPTTTYNGGTYGDISGMYARGESHVVMRVTAITQRKDAVLPVSVPGPAPGGDPWAYKAIERLLVPVLRILLDEVCDINLPDEGAFRNLALVSIEKRFAGGAHKVMHGLWGLGQLSGVKTVVVLDADVNVHDTAAVMARMVETVDFRRDLVVADGPLDPADPAALHSGFGGKLGIDATRKPGRESRLMSPTIDTAMLDNVLGPRWRMFGGCVAVVAVEGDESAAGVIRRVWDTVPGLHVVTVDADSPLDDLNALVTQALGSIDWRRDLRVQSGEISPYAVDAGGSIAVDATRKATSPVVVAPDMGDRISARWREYGL